MTVKRSAPGEGSGDYQVGVVEPPRSIAAEPSITVMLAVWRANEDFDHTSAIVVPTTGLTSVIQFEFVKADQRNPDTASLRTTARVKIFGERLASAYTTRVSRGLNGRAFPEAKWSFFSQI